jgi:hypothetical protein
LYSTTLGSLHDGLKKPELLAKQKACIQDTTAGQLTRIPQQVSRDRFDLHPRFSKLAPIMYMIPIFVLESSS